MGGETPQILRRTEAAEGCRETSDFESQINQKELQRKTGNQVKLPLFVSPLEAFIQEVILLCWLRNTDLKGKSVYVMANTSGL